MPVESGPREARALVAGAGAGVCAAVPARAVAPARFVVQLCAPGSGGVRDCAERLQAQWAGCGQRSQLIALSEHDAREQSLADRLQRLLDDEGRSVTLLLHFSGYGFQRRGLCFWLLREVENARAGLGERLRVVTMFHELFAAGPPWRSAFWLGGAQAWIAARLARRSDGVCTNSAHHARWLREQLPAGRPIQVLPVFSNVGEPDAVPALAARQPRLVVFGSASTRRRAIDQLPRHAATLLRLGIVECVEAGSGDAAPWPLAGLPHRFVGRLDEGPLRALLQAAAFGLIDYPSVHLGKSGVFAAYTAHGCVVLNTAPPGPDGDGLLGGCHYLSLGSGSDLPDTVAKQQALADAGRAWYAGHGLASQARAFAEVCAAALPAQSSPG